MPDFRLDNCGLTRDDIRQAQSALRRHGFDPGAIDGILGPRTNGAIVAFKRSLGYALRSYIGPLTWAALMAPAAPVTTYTREPLPWIAEMMTMIGRHERTDNAALRRWLGSDGHALGDPASLPWCGDAVETAIRLALPAEDMTPLRGNPYWALNWRAFGRPCVPCRGAVVSITRDGGGHVAFAVGEDAGRIYCLGGNQSNRLSIVPVAKSRFVPASWRWPVTFPTSSQARLPAMNSTQASNLTEA